MPLYEYKCETCEKEFEEFVDMGTEEYPCDCGGTGKKLMSKSNWLINGVCYNPISPDGKESSYDEEMKEKGFEKNEHGCYIKRAGKGNKVLYTLFCEECDYEVEDRVYQNEDPTQKCPKCNILLQKKAAFGSYKLTYDPKKDICDWSGNSSAYWNDVKKARQEGRKVKGACEE